MRTVRCVPAANGWRAHLEFSEDGIVKARCSHDPIRDVDRAGQWVRNGLVPAASVFWPITPTLPAGRTDCIEILAKG